MARDAKTKVTNAVDIVEIYWFIWNKLAQHFRQFFGLFL